ncbi:MAG: CHASE3 domain-containing protein [Chthoniobacteraceae bacterium]
MTSRQPLKIFTTGILGVALVAMICAGAFFAYWSTKRTMDALQVVDHSHEVRLQLEICMVSIVDAETSARGYLITGKDVSLDLFKPSLADARGSFTTLESLLKDNPDQLEQLKQLTFLFEMKVERLEGQMKVRREQGLEKILENVGTMQGKQMMDAIRTTIRGMESNEDRLLERRAAATRSALQITLVAVTVGSGVALALVIFGAMMIGRELAARRRAGQLQEVARAHSESIVDTVREPLVVLDKAMRVERANRSFYELFHTSAEKTTGQPFFELEKGVWNDPELKKRLESVFAKNEPFDGLELTLQFPGGSPRTMLLNGRKLFRPGNHTGTALLAIEDVTERRKFEIERDRFFTLAGDLMCVAGFDGYFKRLNPAWQSVLGFSTEELTSTPFMEFLHPDDVEKSKVEVASLTKGNETVSFENRFRTKDGGYRWIQWSAKSVVEDGVIFAAGRDITERKKMEQMHLQFRALFESLPGLYLVLKPDFTIVAVSDAYLKATMTKRGEILERGLFEVFPDNPDDADANGESNLRASLNRVLQNRAPDTMAIQKYDIRRPDGTFEERYWSPINSPVAGEDHSIEYIIHRVEDVTDFVKQSSKGEVVGDVHNRMEKMESEIFKSSQEVQSANRQLESVNAELEAFSYSVSHDLRAPLRHIGGFAEMLEKRAAATLDEKSRRYVTTIIEAAKRMGVLIDDLLVFSRMGRSEMSDAKVDMNSLAQEVIQELRTDQNGRSVVWKCQPLPAVHGDPALLRQVLINLFSNAVKYSRPRDPAVIQVGCNDGALAGETVFFVKDNGVGFDMAYADKLFGVFQRLHRADEFEGTGIGLANVRRIILRHGGRTWAESKPDAGATFFFTLPNFEG